MVHIPAPFQIAAMAGLALTLPGCAARAPAGAMPAPVAFAEAILYDGTGQRTGIATLRPAGGHLQGRVEVTGGLTPGAHGMHIHETGRCTLPDFASAGGHLNPDGKEHGFQNPRGTHAGDLPMIQADSRGAAVMDLAFPATLDVLLDMDGAALVIHADADDMKSDPSGNSGGRVMCGVFYRKMP